MRKYRITLSFGMLLIACLLITACSPKVQSEGASVSGDQSGDKSIEVIAWSEAADCSTCHSAESESTNDSSCQISASHSDLACFDCHDDIDGIGDAHKEVTYGDTKGAKKLKTTIVSQEACLQCHVDDYVPDVVGEVLEDANGVKANPHDLPATEDHGTILCGSCHSMHSDETVVDSAKSTCASCHHTGAYECNTCHEA